MKSLLCSLCWITEHGEGGRKCILSSPQSVFLACVAFSSLPHVWNLFRDEAPLSLGKTQSCFAYWSAFSRLKFFSVSLCFLLFGGHWMFQIPRRFTKKASILIHLQNHHSEDKTSFCLFVFPELQDPFIFYFSAHKINNFNSSVSYWVFCTKNVHWCKIKQIPRNRLLYLQAYE